eukprot:m.175023 g.175023  ORF g.175023 m.175023 type:complete len:544 (-) comp14886_c0_seq5:2463-4094(-)
MATQHVFRVPSSHFASRDKAGSRNSEARDLGRLLAQLEQFADGDQSRHDKSDPVKNFSFDSLQWFQRNVEIVFPKEDQHTKEETKPLPLGVRVILSMNLSQLPPKDELATLQLALISAKDFEEYDLSDQSQLSNAHWKVFSLDVVGGRENGSSSVDPKLAWNLLLEFDGSQFTVLCSRLLQRAIVEATVLNRDNGGKRDLPKEFETQLKAGKKRASASKLPTEHFERFREAFNLAVALRFADADVVASVENIRLRRCAKSELLLRTSIHMTRADDVVGMVKRLRETAVEHLTPEDENVFLASQLLRQSRLMTMESDLEPKDSMVEEVSSRARSLLETIGKIELCLDQAVISNDQTEYFHTMKMLNRFDEADFCRENLPSKNVYTAVCKYRWRRFKGKDKSAVDELVELCGKSFPIQHCLEAQPFVGFSFGRAFHYRQLGEDLENMLLTSKFSESDVPELDEFISWLFSHTEVRFLRTHHCRKRKRKRTQERVKIELLEGTPRQATRWIGRGQDDEPREVDTCDAGCESERLTPIMSRKWRFCQ